MTLLIELAVKSTVVAGAALVLLAVLNRRSAAERSWVAHAALAVLAALPVAVLLLPRWRLLPPVESAAPSAMGPASAPAVAAMDPSLWLQALYAGGAALFLLATLVAVLRLVVLRRDAAVLADPHWLTALSRAQARMRVRSSAALLVSAAVTSPVSWGLIKPTIVVNDSLVASTDDAEAVIAHELAHVARLDWAKLIGARLVTALFWFNPLVWALAGQCHQLREEAADDAVLAAEVSSADYASLLVEAARREGRSLIAVHGVAPGKGSLHRRVTRVLDAAARRTPPRLAWALAVAVGAALFAGPLAALTLEREAAAPAAQAAVTGVKIAAAEPGTAPAAVTVAGVPRAKAAPARPATSITGAAPAKTAGPAAATITGAALPKGRLTLAGAGPRLTIGKPRAPGLAVTAAPPAAPRAPKVAIEAAAGREPAVTLFGKAGGKLRLGDGLTLVGAGKGAPRIEGGPAMTLAAKGAPGVSSSASSSASHTGTVNGKTLRIENDARADAHRRADERGRLKDEADRRADEQERRRDEAERRDDERERRRDEAERIRDQREAERDMARDARREVEVRAEKDRQALAAQARRVEQQAEAAAAQARREPAATQP